MKFRKEKSESTLQNCCCIWICWMEFIFKRFDKISNYHKVWYEMHDIAKQKSNVREISSIPVVFDKKFEIWWKGLIPRNFSLARGLHPEFCAWSLLPLFPLTYTSLARMQINFQNFTFKNSPLHKHNDKWKFKIEVKIKRQCKNMW